MAPRREMYIAVGVSVELTVYGDTDSGSRSSTFERVS